MDETGKYQSPTTSISQLGGFEYDAKPSASNFAGEMKTPSLVAPPSEGNEEEATLGTIAVLSKVLSDLYRFRPEEDQVLLKQLCDTILKELPDMKLDVGEVIEMYYELEEGKEEIANVVAQCHKRHIAAANKKSTLGDPKRDNEMECDAVPITNTSGSVGTEMKQKEKKTKDLKPELLCKVCLDNQVAVTFVPCGHLVTCVTCTAALFECPVCRAHIRGTIRTYI